MNSINDCVLIRKTNIFPSNGIIKTPKKEKIINYDSPILLEKALHKVLSKKFPTQKELHEEYKKFSIYNEAYKSTIHFAINGIITDTIYGIHEYPYAIIEPLKHHTGDNSLCCLRIEDVIFNEDVKLSSEAVIFVPSDEYELLKSKYNLNKLNVQTYTDNIDEAIINKLEDLGYPYVEIYDGMYREGPKSKEMTEFLQKYCNEIGMYQGTGLRSTLNRQDKEKNDEKRTEICKLYIKAIIYNSIIDEELRKEVEELLEKYPDEKNDLEDKMEQVIEQVGLPRLEFLTREFNKTMLSKIR